MARSRMRTAFIGRTRTGKSTMVEQIVKARHEKHKEPAIILDPNRQTRWFPYPAIDFDLLPKLRRGIYRINTMEYERFFATVFNDLKGIQVVCEDSSNYLGTQKNMKIYPNLIGLRHPDHDCDIHFIAHAVSRLPGYIIEQLNEVVLFKTGDTWDKIQDRIPDHLRDDFKACFDRVNTHPDDHYFERFTIQKTGTI